MWLSIIAIVVGFLIGWGIARWADLRKRTREKEAHASFREWERKHIQFQESIKAS